MNLAQALLQALKDHGATRVFGIPGDFALPFFRRSRSARSCRCTPSPMSRASASPPAARRGSAAGSASPR